MLHPGTDIRSDWAEVIQNKFGRFSFACTALPTDDYWLVDSPILQSCEWWFGQQVHVWFLVSIFVVLVKVDNVLKWITMYTYLDNNI